MACIVTIWLMGGERRGLTHNLFPAELSTWELIQNNDNWKLFLYYMVTIIISLLQLKY